LLSYANWTDCGSKSGKRSYGIAAICASFLVTVGALFQDNAPAP